MKKFMEEFKAFALRGNVMDMAVGVIIGGAFSGIVTSLTDNFINPILNVLTGGATYTLQDVSGFASSFIASVVNFIIMAFILFCLLKAVNKVTSLGAKKEEPAAPTTKKCPFCMSEIDIKATRCPHCTSNDLLTLISYYYISKGLSQTENYIFRQCASPFYYINYILHTHYSAVSIPFRSPAPAA